MISSAAGNTTRSVRVARSFINNSNATLLVMLCLRSAPILSVISKFPHELERLLNDANANQELIEQLRADIDEGDVFFEGNPFVGEVLQTHPELEDINRLSVFMSPLSREEILFLLSQPSLCLPDLVTDVMRRKLLKRTRVQRRNKK